MATSHRRIKLTPSFQRDHVPNVHDAFRIVVVASDAHLMPDEIFAFRQIPLQPGTAETSEVFDHVCSPVDLEEYPIGAPLTNAVPPWFRTDTVDLVYRTREQAMEALQLIVQDVISLINGMNTADVLVEQPPFWIGLQPAEAEGSSIGSEG